MLQTVDSASQPETFGEEVVYHSSGRVDNKVNVRLCDIVRRRQQHMVALLSIHCPCAWIDGYVVRLVHTFLVNAHGHASTWRERCLGVLVLDELNL